MAKPDCIQRLYEDHQLELTDLADLPAQQKIIDWQAHVNAFAAERKHELPAFRRAAALDRMKMSVCRNTYLCDEKNRVLAINLYQNNLKEFPFGPLQDWAELRVLFLAENELTEFRLPAALPRLETLDLGDNPALHTLTFEAALPALETLDASDSGLTRLTLPAGLARLKTLDVSRNKLTGVVFEGDCPALEWLDLSGNGLTGLELPKGFQRLTHLYLTQNEVLKELKIVEVLSKLEVLHVANCDITELPKDTILGNSLTALYAANNTPKNIPYIFLGSDRSHNCLNKARLWFTEIRDRPSEKNKQIKLMLLGNGSAGKSTLLCAFQNGKCTCSKRHDTTHGVEIKTLPKRGDVVFNVWDFGGQEVYHGTHRLFMQSPSVQLILFTPKLEQNALSGQSREDTLSGEPVYDHPVEYWYETAKRLSEKSRFIFVQNKRDESPDEDLRIRKYAREHQAESVHVSALEGTDMPMLEFRMQQLATELPGYDMLMPASWLAVRDFFGSNLAKPNPEKTISRANYRRICAENEVHEDTVDLLFEYLRHSGFLYYHDKLGETIIADQKWALDAIYKIFDREKGYYKEMRQRADGQLLAERLFEIFGPEYTDAQKEIFLSFMESCGICFKLNTEGSDRHLSPADVFVIPEFLHPKINPVTDKDWRERTKDVCVFRYALLWNNRFLIESFIARLGRKTEVPYIWRNGIQLQSEDGWFRVELDFNQKVLLVSIEHKAIGKWLKPILEALQTQEESAWKVDPGTAKGMEPLSLDVWLKRENIHLPGENLEEKELQRQHADLQSIEDKPQTANVRTVLILAANPSSTKTIQYRSESGFIQESYVELPGHPALQLHFKPVSNVTSIRFIEAARKHRPNIIHFVGHGTEKGNGSEHDRQLILHDDNYRELEPIDSEKLSQMIIKLMDDAKIPLVLLFLNACSTNYLAQEVSETVGRGVYIIGSDAEITSQNARRFAAKFYTTYCQNFSVQHAVQEGFWHAPEAEKYTHLYQNGNEIPLKNK